MWNPTSPHTLKQFSGGESEGCKAQFSSNLFIFWVIFHLAGSNICYIFYYITVGILKLGQVFLHMDQYNSRIQLYNSWKI